MRTQSKVFAVVYQFGKVASSSLVAYLNTLPDVEAVQSHFLGSEALASILGSCLVPELNDYFFYHQSGQLHHNLGITRRINRIIGGYEPHTRLVVILAVREPLDWLRSAITQDLEGFTEVLHQTKSCRGTMYEDVEELTCSSLIAALGQLADFLTSFGSVDSCLLHRPSFHTLVPQYLPSTTLQQLFYTAVRPFDWHRLMMEPVFHCTLDDFVKNDDLYSLRDPSFEAHLFRYEDVRTAFPQIVAEIGVSSMAQLTEQNDSTGKPFAESVRAAFRSVEAERLAALFRATDYARRFGY